MLFVKVRLCCRAAGAAGEAFGPGGSSAAQARVGKGPRCTPYAVPVPASSARSDRPIPHRSPGIKHPLTNAGPSLKRTRTPSCTNHSDDRARAHWPTAPTGRWESTVETTDAGWADHPMISTEQCPRLSIERRKHHAVRQRGGISFRFTSVTFSTARGSRSWSRVLFP